MTDHDDELGKILAQVDAEIGTEEVVNQPADGDNTDDVDKVEAKTEEIDEVVPAEEVVEHEKGSDEWIDQQVKEKAEKVIEKRLSRETWKKKSTQEELEKLRAELDTMKQQQTPPEPKLTKANFVGDEEGYIEYVAEQKARLINHQENQARAQYDNAVQQVRANKIKWSEAIIEYEKVKPDIREKLKASAEITMSDAILDEILETDYPAAILYDLTDPQEAMKFTNLSDKARNRYLAKKEFKLEQKVDTPIQNTENTATAPATAPAPKPMSVKGSSGTKAGKDPVKDFLTEWRESESNKAGW